MPGPHGAPPATVDDAVEGQPERSNALGLPGHCVP